MAAYLFFSVEMTFPVHALLWLLLVPCCPSGWHDRGLCSLLRQFYEYSAFGSEVEHLNQISWNAIALLTESNVNDQLCIFLIKYGPQGQPHRARRWALALRSRMPLKFHYLLPPWFSIRRFVPDSVSPVQFSFCPEECSRYDFSAFRFLARYWSSFAATEMIIA